MGSSRSTRGGSVHHPNSIAGHLGELHCIVSWDTISLLSDFSSCRLGSLCLIQSLPGSKFTALFSIAEEHSSKNTEGVIGYS
jgi:hypothetical protein